METPQSDDDRRNDSVGATHPKGPRHLARFQVRVLIIFGFFVWTQACEALTVAQIANVVCGSAAKLYAPVAHAFSESMEQAAAETERGSAERDARFRDILQRMDRFIDERYLQDKKTEEELIRERKWSRDEASLFVMMRRMVLIESFAIATNNPEFSEVRIRREAEDHCHAQVP